MLLKRASELLILEYEGLTFKEYFRAHDLGFLFVSLINNMHFIEIHMVFFLHAPHALLMICIGADLCNPTNPLLWVTTLQLTFVQNSDGIVKCHRFYVQRGKNGFLIS